MRWMKRFLALGLSVVLALSTSVTAFAEDVQIFLKDERPIDIVLAAGKTRYDLSKFENEIRAALAANNVDLNRVKVEAIQATSSASEDNFPWVKTGRTGKVRLPGEYSSHLHRVMNPGEILFDGDTEDGYTCGVKYDFPEEVRDRVSKFSLSFTLDPRNLYTHPYCSASFTACGFTIDVDEDLYVSLTGPGITRKSLGHNSLLNLKIEVTKMGATVYRNGAVVATSTASNIVLDGMESSVEYGSHCCSTWAYFILSNVVLEAEVAKDLVDVVRSPSWRNNSHRFVVDINDYAREDLDVAGSVGECIQRLCADDGYYINYGRNASKAQAQTFISKLGSSTMSRDGKRGAYYDNSTNMNAMAQWIEYIVNKTQSGTGDVTVLKTYPFEFNVNPRALAANTATATYENGRWKTNYSTTYQASGDPNYKFEGNLEAPFWTNRYRQDFSFSTAQIGVYDLYFADTAVKPKRIIVHQLPVAKFSQFSVVKGAGKWYDVTFTVDSYDPDAPAHKNPSTNKIDRGIVQHIFQYREAGINKNATWQATGASGTQNANGTWTYKIQVGTGVVDNNHTEWELKYTVKDYQGAVSLPVIKYINGDRNQFDIKPIAAFEFPNSKYSTYEWAAMVARIRNNEQAVYTALQDASYDPMGYEINKYRWQWLDSDGNALSGEMLSNPEDRTRMAQVLGAAPKVPGTYYLQLIVQRSQGGSGEQLVSEAYKRVIEFTREAYSLWFSDLASWDVIQKENPGTTVTTPPVTMKGIVNSDYPQGYNRMTGFTTATIPAGQTPANQAKYARRTTFNQLKTSPSSSVTKNVYIDDNGKRGNATLNLTEYSVELTSEFLWPVTNQQIAAGEAMLSLWGTPTDDWALVPDGVQAGSLRPRYIANKTAHNTAAGAVYPYYYITDTVPWDSYLDKYSLLSVTRGESYRFAAKTPGRTNTPYYVYSSTLNRKVFDWETGTYTQYTGKTEFPIGSSAGVKISVPSRFESIKLQGEGGYIRSGTNNIKQSVAAVYFRDENIKDASATGKLGYVARDNTTQTITVTTPDKGSTKTMYFYVSPETSLITGEVYTDQGLGTTNTYVDDVYATSITPVQIYRLKDNTTMRLDGAILPSTRTERTVLDNTRPDGSQKPITLNFSMFDADAIVRGIRINGANSWTKYNSRNVTYTFTPSQAVTTIDVLVSPEDREIQQLYTIVINVPDTFQSTSAVVSYKTTDQGTFSGVLSGTTFTITLPENVRNGKLCVQAVNQHSVISKLGKEDYNANAVEIDWELPYHSNPNTTFTVKPIAGSSKIYSIKFVKTSTTPTVTVTNSAKLDGIFSPQGRYLGGVYTAYEHITDAAAAFNGNGVPVELSIRNKETVQGVAAEIVFNGEKFPIHWDSYDGPTYRDGQEILLGYAVISKSALAGLNGPQPITCNVYTYDYEGSEPVDIAHDVAVRNITVDSTGPNFSVSNSLNPSMIRFTGISDNMVPVGELTLEWATNAGSGYDSIYTLDTENHPDIQVRVDGVSEELKCRFTMFDVLGNATEVETKLDFSGAPGIDVHMEFGRNADGYYVNVRKNENESIGYDRFEFLN